MSHRRHVYADLQPYTCTEIGCPASCREFARRSQWVDHMQRYHWTVYKCPVAPCTATLPSLDDCEAHICTFHSAELSCRTLNEWSQLAYGLAEQTRPDHCLFCHKFLSGPYERHVGRHLLHLAMLALPDSTSQQRIESSSSGIHTAMVGSSSTVTSSDGGKINQATHRSPEVPDVNDAAPKIVGTGYRSRNRGRYQ